MVRFYTADKHSTRPTGYNADSPMPGLNDIVGQTALKDLIRSKIQLARSGGLTLPHLLLSGDNETGKMTFATAIAQELGVTFTPVSGQTLVKFVDLSGLLSNMRPREILVIEESEGIPSPPVLELLVQSISSFQIKIQIGSGPGAREKHIRFYPIHSHRHHDQTLAGE